ncbi:helix-turn-helix domain-containing protein [Lysinibacillus sp. FSL M8-0134]|uniref:helix-turn-helix domain-containing protein n=1 Tax=Lysinibacillus sp. FSL M8-0134 TaxID=2921717 RepID=UPI00311A17E3
MRRLNGSVSEHVVANIKEIRKHKKIIQEGLAEKSGLQTSYLDGVERGDRNINLQTLKKNQV